MRPFDPTFSIPKRIVASVTQLTAITMCYSKSFSIPKRIVASVTRAIPNSPYQLRAAFSIPKRIVASVTARNMVDWGIWCRTFSIP